MADGKKLVLSGATGFVGRHLLQKALQAGFRVKVLVRDPARLDRAGLDPDALPEALEVETVDLGADPPAPSSFDNADLVIHAAAFIPPDYEEASHARACFEVNTLGTIALLEAALAAGVPRVIALSSGNAYRTAPGARVEDDALFPNRRAGYYLASKAAGDMLTDYYHHAKGLSTATLRVASVYGPGMASGSFLPICIERLAAGQPIELAQGGRPTADWVHADDVAEAALGAGLSDVTGPVNIGSGRATSLLDAATLVADRLGADRDLIRLKPATAGNDGFRPLDIDKARQAFGYAPRSLAEGLGSWISSRG